MAKVLFVTSKTAAKPPDTTRNQGETVIFRSDLLLWHGVRGFVGVRRTVWSGWRWLTSCGGASGSNTTRRH